MSPDTPQEIENIEVGLLLDALLKRYGYDFRHYAKPSLKRRIRKTLEDTSCEHISELIPLLLYDSTLMEQLVYNISVTVTEMFRDPPFFKYLREHIVPYLKTYPFIKIWHAGCATGEEVYSMAILLKEEGLYDRCTILATDFNDMALKKAREGIYPAKDIKLFTANYANAGGKNSFSDYYHAKYDSALFKKSLRKNITFANHNLSTDGVFGEMHLVICRNVLIYFDKNLQDHVLKLFDKSLIHDGYLALGTKETIHFSDIEKNYEVMHNKVKIYRKKKQ